MARKDGRTNIPQEKIWAISNHVSDNGSDVYVLKKETQGKKVNIAAKPRIRLQQS